jgi:hypothetical protein
LDSLQRAIFGLRFRLAFIEKQGNEFQAWFERLMGHAFPADFVAVRPYGREGDLKCDGRRTSTRTIFQCYATRTMKQAMLKQKINVDFAGARANWRGEQMGQWIFVHNDHEGLPPSIVKQIESLRKQHPEVSIETWGYTELLQIKEKLSLAALEDVFGPALTRPDYESVDIDDLKQVIDSLEQEESPPSTEPVTAPSAKKLEWNKLSEDAAELLRIGRRKEALVERLLSRLPRPESAEQIAEAFRNRYRQLGNDGLSPDEVFCELYQFAGSSQVAPPRREAAVLAVLSYFFERCDIFEDAEDSR